MKKKLLAIVLSAAMVAGCLTGCSNGAKNESQKKKNNSEAVNEENASETENTVENLIASTNEKVKLTVWASEEDEELTNNLIECFEAEYPTISFDITVCMESEADAKNDILVDIEAGPDVYTFADDQMNELVQAGALKEVDTTYTYNVKDSNVAGSIDAATVDDKLYAYPMTADNGYFMMYDSSVFSEEDVKSLDTMIKKAKAANKKIAMDISNGWYISSFFKGAGLNITLDEDGINNICTWNDKKGVEVAQAIIDLFDSGAFVNLGDADQAIQIPEGDICAAVNGTWRVGTAEDTWGENYAAAKLPTFTLAGEQKQMYSYSGYKLIGVNPYSKFVGWSMLLAEYLTNYDSQVIRYEKRGLGPANIEAAYSDIVQADPAISALAEQAEFAIPERVGVNFWEPSKKLGDILANGGNGESLQELLDATVEEITAPVQ